MVSHKEWHEAQEWEKEWHASCINSYNEETKQYIYAKYMGLDVYATNYYGQLGWDFKDKSILDVGCGPYSILLKTKTKGLKMALDPCSYPDWVSARYKAAGVEQYPIKGEDIVPFIKEGAFDEVLLYNCLQHTNDPEKICKNLLKVGKTIRVFEWIDAGISPGHLHDLKADKLNEWLGGEGRILELNQSPVVGRAYAGIFKGEHYGT